MCMKYFWCLSPHGYFFTNSLLAGNICVVLTVDPYRTQYIRARKKRTECHGTNRAARWIMRLSGQLGYMHIAKMVDSSIKLCLVNGAIIILKLRAN